MREQGASTRQRILDAVRDVALEHGLERLRIADVARRSGVSPALVHYHFATRDALVAEALRAAAVSDLAATDAALAGVGDPLDRLDRFLDAYAPEPERAGWPLWIDAWGLALRSPDLADILGALDRAWRARLIAIVDDAVARGRLRVGDVEAAAEELLAVAAGLAVSVVVHRSLSPEVAAARLRGAARRLLVAVSP
jgi:AcrR family transcriptional regulator